MLCHSATKEHTDAEKHRAATAITLNRHGATTRVQEYVLFPDSKTHHTNPHSQTNIARTMTNTHNHAHSQAFTQVYAATHSHSLTHIHKTLEIYNKYGKNKDMTPSKSSISIIANLITHSTKPHCRP